MTLERNHSRIYAEGFYAVFIEPKTSDRAALVAYLTDAFEDAYREGLRARQREFAQELLGAIGDRSSVPTAELRDLVSSLRTG